MPFVEAKCTSCGAQLTVDNTKDAAICQYCGTPFIVEKAINHYHTTQNITGSIVNIYGGNSNDFVIRAGKLIKYNGVATEIEIPHIVTIIGEEAFMGCEGLTHVVIPSSVKRIENRAFAKTGITEIDLPDTVTYLGIGVFSDCYKLTKAILPKWFDDHLSEMLNHHGLAHTKTVRIPEKLFAGCVQLTSVGMPNDLGCIDKAAFDKCRNLNLTLPDSITALGESAFNGCKNLQLNSLPSGLNSLGEYAFSGCEKLTHISIPNGIKIISKNAFRGCSGLQSIHLHPDIVKINDEAFSGCTSLVNISLPKKLKTIGYGAFQNCTHLKEITIPDTAPAIGQCAFKNCVNLCNVTIPNSVTDISPSVFEGCTKINIHASNAWKKEHVNLLPQWVDEKKNIEATKSRTTLMVGVIMCVIAVSIFASGNEDMFPLALILGGIGGFTVAIKLGW